MSLLSIRSLCLLALPLALPFSLAACAVESTDASVLDDSAEYTSIGTRFETFQGMDGQYYFHLIAGNGQIILQSQAYVRQVGVQNGILSVLQNGVDANQFVIETANSGGVYFNLLAKNHEVIATSEIYASPSNARRAIRSIVKGLTAMGATPVVSVRTR